MAILLAMYQKMRLIRQINQDSLRLTTICSKVDRIAKNITKTQKRFTSLMTQLDQQVTRMTNNASIFFQNQAGLGVNNFAGSINPYGFNGLNGFLIQAGTAIMANNGIPYQTGTDSEGKPTYAYHKADQNTISAMIAHYSQNGKFVPKTTKDAENNVVAETEKRVLYGVEGGTETDVNVYDGFKQEDVNLFNYAMQQAQMQQEQARMWAQQTSQQYATNVSIWAEAQKAQLEAQQDEALDALSYEDTMLQLEKEQLEARLERLRAEKQSYDKLVSEEAQSMAPTFGLR